jgi:predicted nucleic acid-binding protein
MDILIDTSAILAVILTEPERGRIIEATRGATLLGPGSIRWEIGNAFSAMLKRDRLDIQAALKGLRIFEEIGIRFINVDLQSSVSLAKQMELCAYEAYVLECAARLNAPLLSLDGTMLRAALELGLEVVEV